MIRTILALRSTIFAVFAFGFITNGVVLAQCEQIPSCELVWSDEFDGTAVDLSKWEFQTGDGTLFGIPGWGNNELQWYQANNATVSGGFLRIQAREESAGGYNYTSARMRSIGLGDFLYGRFEMRASLPLGQGMWPAFWMLPSDPSIYGIWAASGEIDIMESIGGDLIYGTIHYGDAFPGNVSSGGTMLLPPGGAANFHVYAVEWEPTEIRWYLDGVLYSTKTGWFSTGGPYPAPFDVDFHLLLNLAVGGDFPGNPTGSTVFPQDYVIDYVRVYQEPPPDPVAAARCESFKTKAAGKHAKCRANAFAKAIRRSAAVETFKLVKCSQKIHSKFAKAEARAVGSCPTEGDAAAVESAVDTCVDDVIADLGGVPGPGGDAAKCQSKKVKTSGKYALCRFKALSKAIKKGLSPDYAKCEEKLLTKWTKLETAACSTAGDHGSVKAVLDVCHSAVSASLAEPYCGNALVDLGEECDDGNSINGDGCSDRCEIETEYEQDFEALAQANNNALADDGWKVFGNVFDGVTGNYLYGYGTNPAPNGAGAFCDIAIGQGGAAQGGQQLSIYSDYNNGDHANGHRIESNVFQERSIVAADIGNTLTFTFDAKRGNLAGATTALAFVKTLDPNNGFATTNFVTVDMTAIPTVWGTHSMALDIGAGLDGQILQYGFSNTASNYEGSGVFYDNIVVSLIPTP